MQHKIYFFIIFLLSLNISFAQQQKSANLFEKSNEYDVHLLGDSANSYVRILVGGNICHEKDFEKNMCSDGTCNYSEIFKYIRSVLYVGDINIAKLETVIGSEFKKMKYNAAPDKFAEALGKSGLNVLTTASYSAADFQEQGIQKTLALLDKEGLRHTGSFRNNTEKDSVNPLILNVKGISIAILNYTVDTRLALYDMKTSSINKTSFRFIKDDIQKCSDKKIDYVIVYLDWAKNIKTELSEEQKIVIKTCVEAGADAVVGTGLQGIQTVDFFPHRRNDNIRKAVVATGLGNLLSNETRANKDKGYILELLIKKNKISGDVTLYDVGYIPTYTLVKEVAGFKPQHYIIPSGNAANNEFYVELSEKERRLQDSTLNSVRMLVGADIPEFRYNITDRVIANVNETYQLQALNPSIEKLNRKTSSAGYNTELEIQKNTETKVQTEKKKTYFTYGPETETIIRNGKKIVLAQVHTSDEDLTEIRKKDSTIALVRKNILDKAKRDAFVKDSLAKAKIIEAKRITDSTKAAQMELAKQKENDNSLAARLERIRIKDSIATALEKNKTKITAETKAKLAAEARAKNKTDDEFYAKHAQSVKPKLPNLKVIGENKNDSTTKTKSAGGGGVFYNSEDALNPNIFTLPDEVFYYIQIYAFDEKYEINIEKHPHLKDYEIVIEDGKYKYLIGKTRDLLKASAQCKAVKNLGPSNAFIVKYVNGMRVPFTQPLY